MHSFVMAQGLQRKILLAVLCTALFSLAFLLRAPHASAAACTTPATDYGTVSGLSTTLDATNTYTYRVWTRMVAPNANDTYLLEIDGNQCITFGGSNVQVATTSPYFTIPAGEDGAKFWIKGSVDVSLSGGAHTLKLIGNKTGVVVDKIIMTQDTTCTPTGIEGSNCATPADTLPPSVSISSPASGSSVNSSTVTVAATAVDDHGTPLRKVELYVDDAASTTYSDTTAPYTFNVSGLSPGQHTFKAKAYDLAGNIAVSTVVGITVANTDTAAPTVSITSPANGATVGSSFTATATATDNVAVTKMELYADGKLVKTSTSATISYTWNLKGKRVAGTHTILVKAYDGAGNAGSSTITVYR